MFLIYPYSDIISSSSSSSSSISSISSMIIIITKNNNDNPFGSLRPFFHSVSVTIAKTTRPPLVSHANSLTPSTFRP